MQPNTKQRTDTTGRRDATSVSAETRSATKSSENTGTQRQAKEAPPRPGCRKRAACEAWLQEVDFLVPGRDDELWWDIQEHWCTFLDTTTPQDDRFLNIFPRLRRAGEPKSVKDETLEQAKTRLLLSRLRRQTMEDSMLENMDELEVNMERWPRQVRLLLNSEDMNDSSSFKSLASVQKVDTRRRYQSVLISMVNFLVFSYQHDLLPNMGLKLDNSWLNQLDELKKCLPDLDDIGCPWGSEPRYSLWLRILDILDKPIASLVKVTPRNDVLLWWTAILVRAAASHPSEEESISNRGDDRNPLPMGLGIRQTINAVMHCYKVLCLHQAWDSLENEMLESEGNEDIMVDLIRVDINWLLDMEGQRPAASMDTRDYSSASWQEVFSIVKDCVARNGSFEGTALHTIRLLDHTLAEEEEERERIRRLDIDSLDPVAAQRVLSEKREHRIDNILFGDPFEGRAKRARTS